MSRITSLCFALAPLALAPFALGLLPQSERDQSKRLVESPLEQALAPDHAPSPPPAADFVSRVVPGLVNWHADFDAACAAARASGKSVLLVQLFGRLDDESCCATARLARSVLFSHPQLASFLNDRFECAWESVGPTPRLALDL